MLIMIEERDPPIAPTTIWTISKCNQMVTSEIRE